MGAVLGIFQGHLFQTQLRHVHCFSGFILRVGIPDSRDITTESVPVVWIRGFTC